VLRILLTGVSRAWILVAWSPVVGQGLNEQTERQQWTNRNVLECKVAVCRQRQSFENRLGFFNRFGVHKEDHAAGLIVAEPELVDLAVEMLWHVDNKRLGIFHPAIVAEPGA
jgi:hypothetical protein